jgi:hypothetical protein
MLGAAGYLVDDLADAFAQVLRFVFAHGLGV